MDDCSRQDPAYRPATEKPRLGRASPFEDPALGRGSMDTSSNPAGTSVVPHTGVCQAGRRFSAGDGRHRAPRGLGGHRWSHRRAGVNAAEAPTGSWPRSVSSQEGARRPAARRSRAPARFNPGVPLQTRAVALHGDLRQRAQQRSAPPLARRWPAARHAGPPATGRGRTPTSRRCRERGRSPRPPSPPRRSAPRRLRGCPNSASRNIIRRR